MSTLGFGKLGGKLEYQCQWNPNALAWNYTSGLLRFLESVFESRFALLPVRHFEFDGKQFFNWYFCKFCPIFKVGSDDLQTKPHKGQWMDFWSSFPFSNKSVMNLMAKPRSKMYMYFSNSFANWNKTLWLSVALYPKSAFNQFYEKKNKIK